MTDALLLFFYIFLFPGLLFLFVYALFFEFIDRKIAARMPRRKLRAYADHIAALGAGDAFVYFNNDTAGAAVRDARALIDLLDDRGVAVAGA